MEATLIVPIPAVSSAGQFSPIPAITSLLEQVLSPVDKKES